MLVRHQSGAAFMRMAQNDEYLAGLGHREQLWRTHGCSRSSKPISSDDTESLVTLSGAPPG
jgi:hypothetical protein